MLPLKKTHLSRRKASLTEREGYLWTASEGYMRGEMNVEQLGGIERQWPPAPRDYEEHMAWRLRWYLAVAITSAYTLSLIGGLIGFSMTKDPRYLLFIVPTILVSSVRYLVPMDKKEHEQKMAKITANKELTEARLQIKMLKAELDKRQGQLPTK